MRQIFNPGGRKADSAAHGNAGSVGSITKTPVPKKTEESPNRISGDEPGESEVDLQNQFTAAAFSNNRNGYDRDNASAGAGGSTTRGLYGLDKGENTVQPIR